VGSFLSWLDHLREEPTSVSFYTDRETRPTHPIADLTHERIKRQPVLGGLINEHERAA